MSVPVLVFLVVVILMGAGPLFAAAVYFEIHSRRLERNTDYELPDELRHYLRGG